MKDEVYLKNGKLIHTVWAKREADDIVRFYNINPQKYDGCLLSEELKEPVLLWNKDAVRLFGERELKKITKEKSPMRVQLLVKEIKDSEIFNGF